MKRLLLSILCLVMASAIYGEDNGHKLSLDSKHYLVKKDKKWYEFKSDILLFKGSHVLEQTCCKLLGGNEQQSLQEFVKERLSTYDSKTQYSQRNRLGLNLIGQEIIRVNVKGQIVGDYQTFEISKSLQEEKGGKDSKQWNIVYDMKNDKVLTVDDIFVPETATMLKNNADGDFISIYVERKMIFCGLTQANGTIKYEILNYVENEDILTEQFKQSLDIDELRAVYNRESEEQRQQELQEQHRQDSLQKVREEYLARTAYKRIFNDYGELEVQIYPSAPHPSWEEVEQSSNSCIRAGGNNLTPWYNLKALKNNDGTTDSLWVRFLFSLNREQRLGVSEWMPSWLRKTETALRGGYSYVNGRWASNFDIDRPVNNLFEQHLCKLILKKSSKQLMYAEEKFNKSFSGKRFGKKKANVVFVRGRSLSYNPGKYYSYAYSYTYAVCSENDNFFIVIDSKKYPDKYHTVGKPIHKNIIYDIKNNKVLSLSDVLTAEEIENLGLKKKDKADLALDNYYLYVGTDGKPVCTYALCRDNWNKFTSVLQDLIAPYDSLPAKIDSTAFVCQDYEGIQPASISYKIKQDPLFRGHADSLLVYLKSHIVLPDTMKSEHSWKVQFVVEKDGHVSNVEITPDKDGEVDKSFASKLTEAFEQMPAWQTLDIDGLGIQESMLTYKIQFIPNANLKDINNEMVETNAQFPGGDEACLEWLSKHVRYPVDCMKKKVSGRVIVSFVVNTDGSIVDVKTIRSPHPSLSKEAERVVKLMPKWIPAMFGETPVRSHFHVPIMFGFF